MTTKRSSYKQATRKVKKIKCFFVMMYKDYRLFSMFEVCAYLNFFAPFSDCFSLFLLPFLVVCKILCMPMSMYFLVFDVLLLKCRYLVWLSLFSIFHSYVPWLVWLSLFSILHSYVPWLVWLSLFSILHSYVPWLVWLSLFSILHSYVPWIPILSTSSPFLHIFASSTCMPHFMLSKPLQHFYNLCITMFKYWRLFNGHHSPKFILSFVFLCQMNNGPNSKIFFCLSFYIQANFWIQSWVILCPFFKQISEESFSMFPPFLSYFSFLLREKNNSTDNTYFKKTSSIISPNAGHNEEQKKHIIRILV